MTYGLAVDSCGVDRPEQVYVWQLDGNAGDDVRPISIEGWVGYGVDSRMKLTTQQARELIPLLVRALCQADDTVDGFDVTAANLHRIIGEEMSAQAGRIIESATRQLEQLGSRVAAEVSAL